MTQQVRKRYRNHRKAAWAAALGVLVATALAIVLPAIGAGAELLPASKPQNVIPTLVDVGGSNFSCSTHTGGVGPAGMSTLKVSDVPNSATTVTYNRANTATLPAGVTFKLTGLNGSNKGKFFAFSVAGARVFHVGVNGGTDTAWYDYATPFPLGVTNDGATTSSGVPTSETGLHATKKDANSFYNASWTTFCFKPVVKIEGTVYRDVDGNGTGDSVLATPTHTVTLFDGSGTTTASTDGSTGKYSFLVPTGGSYTVCMDARAGEVQTKPGATTECTSEGGYSFSSLTTDSSGNDFAFAGGVTAECDSATPLESQFESTDAEVVAKFTSVDGACKIDGKQFVFTTYDEGSSRVAKLSAVGDLPAGTCNLSTGVGCQIVAQKLTWNVTSASPEAKTLKYDDPPYGESGDPRTMLFCNKDPLDRSAPDGVTLLTGTGYFPEDILPAAETTCLIRTTQGRFLVDGSWALKRIDEAYSAYDGKISFG
jgi:hypothetical protein